MCEICELAYCISTESACVCVSDGLLRPLLQLLTLRLAGQTPARSFTHPAVALDPLQLSWCGYDARVSVQDGLGVPVTPLQDPMHYPHGTKWMAPGALTPSTASRHGNVA